MKALLLTFISESHILYGRSNILRILASGNLFFHRVSHFFKQDLNPAGASVRLKNKLRRLSAGCHVNVVMPFRRRLDGRDISDCSVAVLPRMGSEMT